MTLSARIGIAWPSLEIDVRIELESARTLAIVGPNGAGKSTVLRALAGLLSIHRGHIRCRDEVWDDPDSGAFTSPGNRNVGLVFQDHLLFGHMTVLDNVAFGPRARGRSVSAARQEAAQCLQRLDLDHLAQSRPSQLSGGQSQRVALARALVNRPGLLLLDEPLASLDVTTRRRMRSEISRDIASYAPMTILVSHDPEDARQLADQMIVVEEGVVTQQGAPDELASRPATPYIAELLGRS